MCGSDDHSSKLHELLGEWFELCNSNNPGSGGGVVMRR